MERIIIYQTFFIDNEMFETKEKSFKIKIIIHETDENYEY